MPCRSFRNFTISRYDIGGLFCRMAAISASNGWSLERYGWVRCHQSFPLQSIRYANVEIEQGSDAVRALFESIVVFRITISNDPRTTSEV